MTGAMSGKGFALKVTGSGATISDMASMVGYATYAAQHVLVGLVLGALALRTAPADSATAKVRGARSAMLSR
jgi:hypothetical protein